uniref:AB hydrolase-1 domain-containing protein n=1 Tax=Zooxanthella nutricula TaxID=1333877 RepID=A0A7S2KME2_9DINO
MALLQEPAPLGPSAAEAWEQRKAGLETGSLTLEDGRTLSFHIDGDRRSGKPVILLLHGMLSSRVMWVSHAPPEKCVYVVPSRPGYADSSDPGPRYTLTHFARDIERLMDHLGIGEFSVIGHSSGGPPALAVAAALGRRRVKVVACLGGDTEYSNPSPRTPVDPVAKDMLWCFAGVFRRWWTPFFVPFILRRCQFLFMLLGRLASRRTALFLRAMLRPEELPMWEEARGDNFFRIALCESTRAAVDPSPMRSGMAGMINDFAAERLRRFDFDASAIKSKVLFWSGELDKPCLDPTLFNHEVLCPSSELRVVPNRGHLGVLAPDTLAELVDAVLAAAATT